MCSNLFRFMNIDICVCVYVRRSDSDLNRSASECTRFLLKHYNPLQAKLNGRLSHLRIGSLATNPLLITARSR